MESWIARDTTTPEDFCNGQTRWAVVLADDPAALVASCGCDSPGKYDCQKRALAIAALPYLLEACKDLVRAHDVAMGEGAVKLRIKLARDAIAKAIGDT